MDSCEFDKVRLFGLFEEMLTGFGLDWKKDPNLKETPERLVRMYRNIFYGLYEPMPKLKTFPTELDQMIVIATSGVSMCAHHFLPFFFKAWIGYMPDKRVIGMSKVPRLVRWVAASPQIQEELGVQVVDILDKELKPKGVGVVIKGVHLCTRIRGVKDEHSSMATSALRGNFRSSPSVKQEFLDLVGRESAGVDVL